MVFKTLEIGNNVSFQKFKENFYDIIIATNILQATPNISTTLETTRSLRKPSGFLLLAETTGLQTMRTPFAMEGMPGRYLGEDDERRNYILALP